MKKLSMIALGAGFFIYWNTANHYNQQAHLADLRAAEIGQEVKKAQTSTGTDPVEFNPSETQQKYGRIFY